MDDGNQMTTKPTTTERQNQPFWRLTRFPEPNKSQLKNWKKKTGLLG